MLIHNELKDYDFEANERVRLYREKESVSALTIFDIVTCDGLTVLWTFYSNYDRENNVSRYTSFFESIHFHFLEYGWISDKQVRKMKDLFIIPDLWIGGEIPKLPGECDLSELNGEMLMIETAKREMGFSL